MNKIVKSFVIAIAILFLLSPMCLAATDINVKNQVKQEDGSLFEKIIAECIRRNSTNYIRFYNSVLKQMLVSRIMILSYLTIIVIMTPSPLLQKIYGIKQ